MSQALQFFLRPNHCVETVKKTICSRSVLHGNDTALKLSSCFNCVVQENSVKWVLILNFFGAATNCSW